MEDPRRRRSIGTIGVALNLALLCYFKYTNFIFDSINVLSGAPLPFMNIVLPLGISFFTFQQIAYLVDVMRGATVERDIVSYSLFVSFFPHLIAGPPGPSRRDDPAIQARADVPVGCAGGARPGDLAAGLFKKVVIADNLAQFVSPVFAHLDAGGGVTTSWAWLAILSYTLQIYFDFSGYSDMAVGLALLFGIRLPVNFRSPYKATSIIDFWRRWHITLSRFLRDYLYIPLGGNRLGEQRRYLNLVLTMLLGGLWHGAGWNFLIWGGLHGLYLCVNHLWQKWRGVTTKASTVDGSANRPGKALSWSITFFAVVIAWVFFRARTLAGAWQMLGASVRRCSWQFGLCLAGYLAGDGSAGSGRRTTPAPDRQRRGLAGACDRFVAAQCPATLWLSRISPRTGTLCLAALAAELAWALLSALAFATSLFGMWQHLEFLYFQF